MMLHSVICQKVCTHISIYNSVKCGFLAIYNIILMHGYVQFYI
jgi:hypothetical protein